MNIHRFVGAVKPEEHAVLARDEVFRREVETIARLTTARAARAVLGMTATEARRAGFAARHEQAWAELLSRLGHWERLDASLELPRQQRVLIAAWHFPEVPSLFNFARRRRVLLLVSQDPPWLAPLREAGCTLNIFDANATRTLMREMSSGRVVAGMFDHHHAGTRSERAALLGRTVETPAAIFELASRFRYLVAFIAPRAGGVEVVATVDAADRTPAELAREFNARLEAEVRRAPDRWLMWQALRAERPA